MAETTEVLEQKKIKVKEREPLFSKKNKKLISDPLDENNPSLFKFWVYVPLWQ